MEAAAVEIQQLVARRYASGHLDNQLQLRYRLVKTQGDAGCGVVWNRDEQLCTLGAGAGQRVGVCVWVC